jgi:hypothetical protein
LLYETQRLSYFLDVLPEVKKYWSPQIHIELVPHNEKSNETHLRCLFGPDQTLWTMFMFLNFIIVAVFVSFAGIAFSNYMLKLDTTIDFVIMILMLIAWFLLYIIARQMRYNGFGQMNELEAELDIILNYKTKVE